MFNKHFEKMISTEEMNTFSVACPNVFSRCPITGKWMFLRKSTVVTFVDVFPKFANLYFCDPSALAMWMLVNYPLPPKKDIRVNKPRRKLVY